MHRDLKPANVKVRPDGTVKVLDFGLAKAWYEEAGGSDPAHSPTITGHHTRAGVILGTAAYMSPEQARGRPVDRQSDVWAFGCVVYEMLSGRRAFGGETVTDTLAAVLREEPAWSALPADVGPGAAPGAAPVPREGPGPSFPQRRRRGDRARGRRVAGARRGRRAPGG